MTYGEATDKLTRLGCEHVRRTRKNNHIWANANTESIAVIPDFGSKDLRANTISRIIRALGITKRAFDQA